MIYKKKDQNQKKYVLNNYLPFNGGFKQHYQIRNFGQRDKPKKGTKNYAIEYQAKYF